MTDFENQYVFVKIKEKHISNSFWSKEDVLLIKTNN